jgi:hypothetical protein
MRLGWSKDNNEQLKITWFGHFKPCGDWNIFYSTQFYDDQFFFQLATKMFGQELKILIYKISNGD